MENEPSWYRRTGSGWFVNVHAQPGARKSEVVGLHGGSIKIRVASPPVNGRANEALIAFVAKALGLPNISVSLARGETSRRKTLHIAAQDADPSVLLEQTPATSQIR